MSNSSVVLNPQPLTRASQTLSTPVIAIVRVASPWYAPNWLIARQFARYIGDYERLVGLERKLYTIGEDRHYGGIYYWSNRHDAETFYSPQWATAIREKRGSAPDLRLWDAPAVLEGTTPLNATPLSDRSQSAPATATLSIFTPSSKNPLGDKALASLSAVIGTPTGLVRTTLLSGHRGEVGMVNLWTSPQNATAFFSSQWVTSAQATLGTLHREIFKVPVQMNPARS